MTEQHIAERSQNVVPVHTAGESVRSAAMPADHAHAVLHCNINTLAVERATAFHMLLFGLEPRMRSVGTDDDSAVMGLGSSTASTTTFLFDQRGPRAAPAVELVGWSRPRTEPARPGMATCGFTALGYRVASLAVFRARLDATGYAATEVAEGVSVRGATRRAVRLTDVDGVVVEVVEIASAAGDPSRAALVSHERMRCGDLEATIAWYRGIGWEVRARGEGAEGPTASLVLPEDPTFSLEFEQFPAVAGAPRPANVQGLYRIALAVDDVRAAHAALVAGKALGIVPEPVTFAMPDIPTGGFTVLFLTDPDGAVVELVERPRSTVLRPREPR
ncbi:VOC family protein [Nocardia sp. NBC_00565]|uniref:VOC family protein n=1 Tax=Nocardia sp. NBC_00565 TaxID=2975993 RepID=UPI002E80E4B2|nr:VOC family protein [Nocardia sp. NBC_00565]WUC05770.1 VOC family protein [Nocardia sp. NBC_00565]